MDTYVIDNLHVEVCKCIEQIPWALDKVRLIEIDNFDHISTGGRSHRDCRP